ncbi:hypothetical protein [Haloprofundus halophilus]|nr:hypothetical protein [Haloprofundus halophilus]QCJ48445.1 hypothetical protein FCF25_00435 [Haloprofundus sp. MHR1]
MAQAQESGADVALIASALSVALSWYQFYIRGNKTRGIFIGLWPPTFLAFASYMRQKGMADRLENSVVVNPESQGLLSRVLE